MPIYEYTCGKCGEVLTTPKKFYSGWIIGGGLVFFLMYMIGTFVGATLVEFSVQPSKQDVRAAAQDQGVVLKKDDVLTPDQQEKAQAAALAKAKQEMSGVLRALLLWFVPFILFAIAGMMVGFISRGRTVVEGAIASVVGQILGFVVMRFMYKVDLGFIELIAFIIIGFFLAGAGAYMGEAVQEKKEREALRVTIGF